MPSAPPPLVVVSRTITPLAPNSFQIDGLESITATDGAYEFTLAASAISDPAGNAGSGAASRSWTLDTLARTANMSRSAFSARFRELVGASPHDYLISWRLTVGKQLLHRRYPVSQVAAELGYTSSSFSRVFMQREGVSPRVWVETAAA